MLHANFNSYNNYVTDSLYQWDLNQDLVIEGLNLSVAPEIHFSNARMDKAIVRQSTLTGGLVIVRIPNSLLQESLTIKGYIGLYEGESFKIIESIEIPIIARERPSDYSFTDSDGEIYSFNALEHKVENAVNTMTQSNEELQESVDSLVKQSVTPIYETIYEGGSLNVGDTISIDNDKYAFYIATLHNTSANCNVILNPLSGSNSVYIGGDTYPTMYFRAQISVSANDPKTGTLTVCQWRDTPEFTNTSTNNAVLTKLIGVSKAPSEYITVKHTYDPESEDAISGKGVEEALSRFKIPEDNTGSGVSEAQRQTLLAVINAIGLFNVPNAQVLLDNFNKAWDIVEPVPATSITLDKTELTFTSEDTQTITATVLPLNTTDVVVWNSSNTSVATVKNGVITPLIDGETVITATAGNVSATCNVVVNLDGDIENPVYMYSGFLGTTSTATSDPEINTTYPNAICMTAIPVKNGDTVSIDTNIKEPMAYFRWRFYDENGAYVKNLDFAETITTGANGFVRLNVMDTRGDVIDGETFTYSNITVTNTAGIETIYTVVDKR